MPIAETKFDRLTKKAQEKTKIKVKVHGIKALAQEKKETKLREREELLRKVDEVAFSLEKSKGTKKTT